MSTPAFEIMQYRRIDTIAGKATQFKLGYCEALVYTGIEKGKKWATVYEVHTDPRYRNQGYCQTLLAKIKAEYEVRGFKFGLWCPMNDTIKHITEKLKIKVY